MLNTRNFRNLLLSLLISLIRRTTSATRNRITGNTKRNRRLSRHRLIRLRTGNVFTHRIFNTNHSLARRHNRKGALTNNSFRNNFNTTLNNIQALARRPTLLSSMRILGQAINQLSSTFTEHVRARLTLLRRRHRIHIFRLIRQ